MSFPNEHTCMLLDPGQFVRFRRDNSKDPNVMLGFREDGTSATQSFRYPASDWTEAKARGHSDKQGGTFEVAQESESTDAMTERRYLVTCELRAADGTDDKPLRLEGLAARFNSLSEPMWGFREKIDPGAFAKSIARQDDVRALVEHKGGLTTLGRTKSGTLELREDKTGLRATIFPPDTQAGRDVVELVKRGDLSQMSFAFRTVEEHWDEKKEIRTLIEVDLFDVSVVAFPAYTRTSVTLRSLCGLPESANDSATGKGELDIRRRKLEIAERT